MQILQVSFLQDLQDLALNLAILTLKMIKILQEDYLKNFIAIFLQDFSYLARKASF